ncbi:hypothetical protein [Vulcanisaeta sp. JCM 16159]|uniref:hypothetical protein n=1 Tax=Vulcanisaeta sp. JCM 16159 TaxID=1295371 RepID=UPI0006D220B5|nr:hypothetical protein [Vulcanisaeta sp. JCM 16159]
MHLFYYNGYTGAGDGAPQIGPYTKLYIVNGRTILGVINASNGLREVTYYELVGNLPVVYVNFTVSNLPQSTMVWYGINFINDIYVDANPGETTWVVALGVGNYSFPAQDPNEMYNLAINWGFKATLTPDQFTPGSFAIIYIPPSAGQFAWMEINQPGVGTYYLALYPLTPIDGYYVVSANGWGFDKVIGLVFSNDTTSANGALLVVYGSSLSNLEQNINEALSILGVSTKPSTHTSTQPALGLSLIVTIIVIVLVIIIGIVLIMSIRGRRSKGGGETRGPIESAPPPPPSLPQQSMEGTRIYSSETLVKSAQEETRVKEKEQ